MINILIYLNNASLELIFLEKIAASKVSPYLTSSNGSVTLSEMKYEETNFNIG